MTLIQNVRIQMLGRDDDTTLSDEYLNLLLSDAKDQTSISNESSIPLRYYTCYLVAMNWESIGAIAKREGTEYRAPDPQKYLDLYLKSIQNEITTAEYGELYAQKVSTNRDFEIDPDTGFTEKTNNAN